MFFFQPLTALGHCKLIHYLLTFLLLTDTFSKTLFSATQKRLDEGYRDFSEQNLQFMPEIDLSNFTKKTISIPCF